MKPMKSHLSVKVQTKAKRTEIAGHLDGCLKIRVHAVPEKGAANRELLDFLSARLKLAKSSLTIISGHSSTIKLIEIEGIDETEIKRRLGIEE
jgi:uncharacterized protein